MSLDVLGESCARYPAGLREIYRTEISHVQSILYTDTYKIQERSICLARCVDQTYRHVIGSRLVGLFDHGKALGAEWSLEVEIHRSCRKSTICFVCLGSETRLRSRVARVT
jgi:hypothetical protein